MRFEAFIYARLAATGDERVVVTDPQARYFGALLRERTLLPGDNAPLGSNQFDDWLDQQSPRT
jgi:hypothetical protein